MNPCPTVGDAAQESCRHTYAFDPNRTGFVRTCVHCKAEEPQIGRDPRTPGVIPLELVGTWPGPVAPLLLSLSARRDTPPDIAREHREALLRRIAQRAGEAAQASRDLHTALALLAEHDRAYTPAGEYRV